MKQFLSVIGIILLIASTAHSQSSSKPKTDSTTLPNTWLINALKKVDSLEVMKREVVNINAQNAILQERIKVKDETLALGQIKQGMTDALVTNLKGQVATRDIRIIGLGTEVRRQKTGKVLAIIGGVLGMIGTGYIFSH